MAVFWSAFRVVFALGSTYTQPSAQLHGTLSPAPYRLESLSQFAQRIAAVVALAHQALSDEVESFFHLRDELELDCIALFEAFDDRVVWHWRRHAEYGGARC